MSMQTQLEINDALGGGFVQGKGHEYIPTFLTKDEADALYDFMMTLPWADHQPSCQRVSFGPQMKPIPQPGRTGNINQQKTWPQLLLNLKERIEARYDCCFNSIECHLHENENSKVRAHRDAQPGYIAMVSVGQPRRFTVQEKTLKTYLLAHGSLLTFFGRIEHSMPAETQPCAPRIALVFRYNPRGLVESGSKRTPEQKRADRAEFEKAQADWRQAHATVGKQQGVGQQLIRAGGDASARARHRSILLGQQECGDAVVGFRDDPNLGSVG